LAGIDQRSDRPGQASPDGARLGSIAQRGAGLQEQPARLAVPEGMTTDDRPARARSDLRFLIIGAGMSGILAAIKLKEAGFDDYAIYEKAERLGGTWRENTYPGLACDVPSHFYCYSFAMNPEWSRRFSPGAEIQAYFEEVAQRYGVASQIQYRKEVTRCALEDGRWKIEMSDGSTDVGDFVIAATGVLHHPAYPDVDSSSAPPSGSCPSRTRPIPSRRRPSSAATPRPCSGFAKRRRAPSPTASPTCSWTPSHRSSRPSTTPARRTSRTT
jgi:hypothetical protein